MYFCIEINYKSYTKWIKKNIKERNTLKKL